MNRQILSNFSIFGILIRKISGNPGRINSFDIGGMEDLENIINIYIYLLIYGDLIYFIFLLENKINKYQIYIFKIII